MPGYVRKIWHQNIEKPRNFVKKRYFYRKKNKKIWIKHSKLMEGNYNITLVQDARLCENNFAQKYSKNTKFC